MCDAIVLAAGYSSRANTNKLTWTIDGIAILKNIVMTLQQSCEQVIVVGGHYYDEVCEVLADMACVEVIHNPRYDLGMFSSVKAGVSLMKGDFLLTPGDCPLIKQSTCEQLIGTPGEIVVPTYEGRRGHPILIRKHLIGPLMDEADSSNLKAFRDRYEVTYVPVSDEGILLDIDTINDYEKIKNQVEGSR